MKTAASTSFFDPLLTPRNARKKGYEYIEDVIYDVSDPSDAMKEILGFCTQFGCKLGRPTQENHDQFFGLYLPREKK